MRIFLDSNILISAFSPTTTAHELLQIATAKYNLVLGRFVLDEVRRVLVTKFNANPHAVEIFIEALISFSVHVEPIPSSLISKGLRDPDDEVVLTSAIISRSDILVTRDKDLLDEAHRIDEVLILAPKDFFERFVNA